MQYFASEIFVPKLNLYFHLKAQSHFNNVHKFNPQFTKNIETQSQRQKITSVCCEKLTECINT